MFVCEVVGKFSGGQECRRVGTIDQLRAFFHCAAAMKRMDRTAYFFHFRLFSGQREAENGEESKIVAERESGALPGAGTHGPAKTAIAGAVTFIVPQAQVARLCFDISEHPATSYPFYHILFFPKKQVYFVNILCIAESFFAESAKSLDFLSVFVIIMIGS